MDAATKREFVCDLIDTVRDEILGKLDRVPQNWDGHELREYIADKFGWQRGNLSPSDKREYKNAVLINNL